MSLLSITFILGFLATLIIRLMTKHWFTPNIWYWLAWSLAIACANFAAWGGVLPPIGPFASRLIIQSHIGAFIGFLVASYFLSIRSKKINHNKPMSWSLTFPQKLLNQLSVFYAAVAIVHLLYRVVLVGKVNELLYATIRQEFLVLRDPYHVTQFASLSFTLIPFIFALIAAEDRFNNEIRLKRLLPLFFAAVLHGVAMGGRIWLAIPVSYYLFSYTLLHLKEQPLRLSKLIRAFFPLFSVIVLLFIAFGSLRSTGAISIANPASNGSWYQQPRGIMSPITYVGVAPASLELTSRFASQIEPLKGQLLMPWFAKRLDDLGVLTRYMSQETVMRRNEVRAIDHRVAATQCTVLCLVVGDFGVNSTAYVMGILMAGCQFFALVWVGKGYVAHAVATTLTAAAFLTIQDGWFGIPLNAIGLIGVVFLAVLIKHYQEREKMLKRRQEMISQIALNQHKYHLGKKAN